MSEPTLHPNLAKLAAAYDEILERLGRNQLSPIAARAEIAQLEARDDQGIRWNIDPDSGEWVRKTVTGDVEYDSAPPTSGYMTPDAFDYTSDPQVFNPADRLELAKVDDELERGPSGLAGATRKLSTGGAKPGLTRILQQVKATSTKVRVIAVVVVVALLALLLSTCSGPDQPPSKPVPMPTKTATKKPTKKATKKPTQPARPAATAK